MQFNAHQEMAMMRESHPDWIWNRSDTHIFLGEPGSLDPFKVVVEPGNSFSPGAGTFGVSAWILDHRTGSLHTPESMDIGGLDWGFVEGHIPILVSRWKAGPFEVESRLFTSGNNETSDHKAYLRLLIDCPDGGAGSLLLAIRSFGPAGGPVRNLDMRNDSPWILINGQPGVLCGQTPDSFKAVSLHGDGLDISVPASDGTLDAHGQSAIDEKGWASGAAIYGLEMAPGEHGEFGFLIPIHSNHWLLNWLERPEPPIDVAGVEAKETEKWRAILHGIRLRVPDKRFSDSFYCQVAHEYMATVHNAVRISPISYPMWWLRDGVYLLNALDKAGLHDFSRKGSLDIAHMDAFGGMGAEGDGPGESLWILTEHYLLTRDTGYLEEAYPHMVRKARLLMEMLHTEKPVKRLAEFRTSQYLLDPTTDILCGPSKDGLITGRMDGHYPTFWVNGFAYAGLKRAAKCARILGDVGNAQKWETEAEALRLAILRKMGEFGGNERDVTGGIWPNKALKPEDPGVREAFRRFWDTVRCPEGRHNPERLWTYFELGQAHNYMFLGMREEMWVSLDHFLDNHTAQGLYTWSEGEGDENGSNLWQRIRGWDRIPFITPHGWTSAEMFLLLRDSMAYEDESPDGEILVLGAGVPASWLEDRDGGFGIAGLPTYFGKCDWHLEGTALSISTEQEPPGGYVLALPDLAGVSPQTPGVRVLALGDGRFGLSGIGDMRVECSFDIKRR